MLTTTEERERFPIDLGVSWSGVLAGTLATLITHLVLVVLGTAVGVLAVNAPDADPGGLAIGAAIWYGLSAAAAAFIGGMTAAAADRSGITQTRGRLNGLLTGMLFLLTITLFTGNVLFQTVNRTFGLASSALTAAAVGASQAGAGIAGTPLTALGLREEYQTLVRGLDWEELNEIIADASPQLNERQVAAATAATGAILRNSWREVRMSLSNPSRLDDVVSRQIGIIQQQLQSPEFQNRLQSRGLSATQAQEVVNVVNGRVTELGQTADTLAQQAEAVTENTTEVISKASWTWLLFAGIILGAGFLGGQIESRNIARHAEKRVVTRAAH